MYIDIDITIALILHFVFERVNSVRNWIQQYYAKTFKVKKCNL